MMHNGYVFFDIDGTLCEFPNGPSQKTQEALEQLKENGYRPYLCTGRALCDIPTRVLNLGFDGVISSVGAHVMVGEEVIFEKTIPEKELKETLNAILDCGIRSYIEGPKTLYCTREPRHVDHCDGIIDSAKRIEDLAGRIKVSTFGFHYEDWDQMTPCIPYVEKHSRIIRHHNNCAESALHGITKATGIRKVMEYLGEDMNKTFAIGDSLNDIEMLEEAGTGIAMGHAPDLVKKSADYVTRTLGGDGIYYAMKYLELI